MAYGDRLLERIRKLFKDKDKVEAADVTALVREERAREGGFGKAAKAGSKDDKGGEDGGKVAASDTVELAEASIERFNEAVYAAVSQTVQGAHAVRIIDDEPRDFVGKVVYMKGGFTTQEDGTWKEEPIEFFRRSIKVSADRSNIEIGDDAEAVERVESYEPVAANDDDTGKMYTLSDVDFGGIQEDSGTLPTWLQLHRIGSWAVEHASAGKIELTREKGDEIINNFNAGVLRTGVPLDERHQTDNDGHALGWFKEIKWGSEGQGLPGAPAPDGTGPILYGRIEYTGLGTTKLTDRQYQHISPQYDRDYVDKETGKGYGWVMLAAAATNRPFLRLRSIQGEPCPEPVALSDGTRRNTTKETPVGTENNQPPAPPTVSLEDVTSLKDRIRQLESERKVDKVTAIVNNAINAGVPPALAKKFGNVMLALDQDGPSVVSLDDSKPDQKVSQYAAVQAILNEMPTVKLGVSGTYGDNDKRPDNAANLNDEYDKLAKEFNARVNGTATAAPATPASLSATPPATRQPVEVEI